MGPALNRLKTMEEQGKGLAVYDAEVEDGPMMTVLSKVSVECPTSWNHQELGHTSADLPSRAFEITSECHMTSKETMIVFDLVFGIIP